MSGCRLTGSVLIPSLPSLTVLDVSGNSLDAIAGLACARPLRYLLAAGNPTLSSLALPCGGAGATLPALYSLDVSNCNLAWVPDPGSTALVELRLEHNALPAVPAWVAGATGLTALLMAHNVVPAFPLAALALLSTLRCVLRALPVGGAVRVLPMLRWLLVVHALHKLCMLGWVTHPTVPGNRLTGAHMHIPPRSLARTRTRTPAHAHAHGHAQLRCPPSIMAHTPACSRGQPLERPLSPSHTLVRTKSLRLRAYLFAHTGAASSVCAPVLQPAAVTTVRVCAHVFMYFVRARACDLLQGPGPV